MLSIIQREMDESSDQAEDKCIRACLLLLEEKHEDLLKSVGWDLLHSFLPFVAEPKCTDVVHQLLTRAAALCNPRELFSMVMEAFILFKVCAYPAAHLPLCGVS